VQGTRRQHRSCQPDRDIMAAVLVDVAWNVQLWRGCAVCDATYVDLRAVPRWLRGLRSPTDAQAMALRHGSSWAAPMERSVRAIARLMTSAFSVLSDVHVGNTYNEKGWDAACAHAR